MSNNKPNHVCKFSGCQLGENYTRKSYYACDDCDKYNSWRSVACCFEHFMEYQNEVAVVRGKKIPFPELLSTSNFNVASEIIFKKEVKKDTKKEK